MAPKFERIAMRFFVSRNLPLVSYNRPAPGLLYRPDFVFHNPNRLVIVECDENQHVLYCQCKETEREERIRQAYRSHYNVEPLIFRYDPQPPGERACVRAAMVADIVYRELHGLKHTPTTERLCKILTSEKIVLY
jgi:hypothetical protein